MNSKIQLNRFQQQIQTKLQEYFTPINEIFENTPSNDSLTHSIESLNKSEEELINLLNEFKEWKNQELLHLSNSIDTKEENEDLTNKRYSYVSSFLSIEEMNQLETMTECSIDWILFDSTKDRCTWNTNNSSFFSSLKSEANILLLFVTDKGSQFGIYLNDKIFVQGGYLNDKNAFVFSIQNGTIVKHSIDFKNKTIVIKKQEDKELLTIANDSIVINKEEYKSNCSFIPVDQSNESEEKEKQFFSISRIVAIKMKDEKNGIKQMMDLSQYGITEFEQKSLTYWIHKQFQTLLFDSSIDEWNLTTSILNQKIISKNNLVFIIEDENGNVFGYYHASSIKKYTMEWSPTNQTAFLFSLRRKGSTEEPKKYELLNTTHGCELYNNSNNLLVSLAASIVIYKENNKEYSHCIENDLFVNLHGEKNVLCGKTSEVGYDEDCCFIPKRILIFQMK